MSLKGELISNVHSRSEENRAFRLVWIVAKEIFGADKALESLPESGSMRELCQAITARFNIELVTNQTPEWAKRESTQAVLIYGPHTFHVEPYIILSLIERDDVYFVAMESAKQLVPESMKDHVFSVIPTFLAKDAPRRSGVAGVMQWIRRALFTNNTEKTVREIRASNQQALQRVALLLQEGHVVMIFPCASGDIKTDRWYTGIGTILQSVSNTAEHVMLQPFNLTQISFRRLLREMRSRFVKK
ncbi:hypothetical protein KC573_03705, partial [candidate division WWE3 bacterium]|nr:hypothetical protein [candidate division WWE3 bacterium]